MSRPKITPGGGRFTPIPAEFFQKCPLYRKFACEIPPLAQNLEDDSLYPAVVMSCNECGSPQTFRIGSRQLDGERIRLDGKRQQREFSANAAIKPPDMGAYQVMLDQAGRETPSKLCVTLVDFVCAGCSAFFHKIAFRVTEDGKAVQKVGQWPPVSTEEDDAVSKFLNKTHVELYRKGQRSEAHDYGIGAFAYYRRILEVVISDLLADIEEAIPDDADKKKYHEALQNLRDSQSAAIRIEAVKDLLPTSLRPGGRNPLTTLYDALSVGLHGLSDEECLAWAEAIRKTLAYLIQQVETTKENAKQYATSMDVIRGKLDRLGGRKTDVK